MNEQLSLFAPPPPSVKHEARFAECRQRVALGCGGHHYAGPVFAGHPIFLWFCCPTCPNRDELNPRRAQ